jgi:hypothetical protein
MTPPPTGAGPRALTQIQPQFRTIDGLSIRYAESEPRETHALLLSPGRRVCSLSRPHGSGWPSTRTWSRSTCPASATPCAATSFSPRAR